MCPGFANKNFGTFGAVQLYENVLRPLLVLLLRGWLFGFLVCAPARCVQALPVGVVLGTSKCWQCLIVVFNAEAGQFWAICSGSISFADGCNNQLLVTRVDDG